MSVWLVLVSLMRYFVRNVKNFTLPIIHALNAEMPKMQNNAHFALDSTLKMELAGTAAKQEQKIVVFVKDLHFKDSIVFRVDLFKTLKLAKNVHFIASALTVKRVCLVNKEAIF